MKRKYLPKWKNHILYSGRDGSGDVSSEPKSLEDCKHWQKIMGHGTIYKLTLVKEIVNDQTK